MAADGLSFHELLGAVAARHEKVVHENQQLRGKCTSSCSCASHAAEVDGQGLEDRCRLSVRGIAPPLERADVAADPPPPPPIETHLAWPWTGVNSLSSQQPPHEPSVARSPSKRHASRTLRGPGPLALEDFGADSLTSTPASRHNSKAATGRAHSYSMLDIAGRVPSEFRCSSKSSNVETPGSEGSPQLLSRMLGMSKSMFLTEVELWPLWTQKPEGEPNSPGVPMRFDCSFNERGGNSAKGRSYLQRFILHPSSMKRLVWDLVSVVVLSCDVITIPLLALALQESIFMTASFTVFWGLDIIVSFISGFYNLGFLEMRPSKIARRYIRKSFVLDFGVFLMDCATLFVSPGSLDVFGVARTGKIGRMTRIFRFTRLIRVVKIPGLARIADYVQSEMLSTSLSIGRTLAIIALICHYIACCWFAVGGWEPVSWISRLERQDTGYTYLTALHWSLTQFMPASMEVHPTNAYERVFTIFVIMAAMCVFSSFVSSMTAAMTHLQHQRQQRLRQTGNIQRYMMENRISMRLGAHIMAFLRAYDFNARQRLHENDLPVFQVLPDSLRVQLHWEIYHPMLVTHPIFYHFNEICKRGLLDVCHTAMAEQSLILTEELFTPGQEANTMYFVVSGVLGYYTGWADDHHVELGVEQWFCEAALWVRWETCGRVVAMTPCELLTLDAPMFRKHVARHAPLHKACSHYAVLYKESLAQANTCGPADVWCDTDMTQEMVHKAFQDIEAGPSTPHGPQRKLSRMRKSYSGVDRLSVTSSARPVW